MGRKNFRTKIKNKRLNMDELKKLHDELNQLKWIGSDEGWDLAIIAVQKRILELVNKC